MESGTNWWFGHLAKCSGYASQAYPPYWLILTHYVEQETEWSLLGLNREKRMVSKIFSLRLIILLIVNPAYRMLEDNTRRLTLLQWERQRGQMQLAKRVVVLFFRGRGINHVELLLCPLLDSPPCWVSYLLFFICQDVCNVLSSWGRKEVSTEPPELEHELCLTHLPPGLSS